MITIILSVLFGAIGGVGIMGAFNSRSYDKGYNDGVAAKIYAIIEQEDEE